MLITLKFLDPTEKPERMPPLTLPESILLKASMAITNRNRDKGSPSQTMGAIEETRRIAIHQNRKAYRRNTMCAIYQHHFPPKSYLLKYNKNSQLT